MRAILLVAILGAAVAMPAACAGAAEADPAELDFFESKIRPVLVAHCYECHSAKTQQPKGQLFVDTREGIRRGGESGEAVVPGEVDESLLIEALRYGEDSYQMPPQGKLPEAVIADFVKWVEIGAPDPRDGSEENRNSQSVADSRDEAD